MAKQVYEDSYIRVTAPPATHFAFNPWRVTVEDLTAVKGASALRYIDIEGERREFPSDGGDRTVTFDLARWVQSQFVGVVAERLRAVGSGVREDPFSLAPLAPVITVCGPGGSAVEAVAPFEFFAVWGSLAAGETYGADVTLPWFTACPLLLMTAGGTVKQTATLADGTRAEQSYMVASSTVAINIAFRPREVEGAVRYDLEVPFFRVSGQEGGDVTRRVTLVPDCAGPSHRRVYLRWVDAKGELQHHLFHATEAQEAVAVSAFSRAERDEPDIYTDGWCDALPQGGAYTRTRTRTLGEDRLPADEYARLASVTSSPLVQVFDGYDDDGETPLWHSALVSAGTYTRDRAHLHSLTFTITEEVREMQTL